MATNPHSRRILVVEDEMLVAMLIEDQLTSLGYTVIGPVGQLAKAEKIAREEAIDGALLDINLAGQPVYPVAEVLTSRAVPLAFVTGFDTDELFGDWQAYRSLEKPFQQHDLVQLMNGLWGGQ